MGGFCVFGWFGFVFVLILALFFHYNQRAAKLATWQKVAQANDLTFVPCQFLGGGYVFGEYGDFHLRLDTVNRNKQDYTRLALLSYKPLNSPPLPQNQNSSWLPVTVETVTNLLTTTLLPKSLNGQITIHSYNDTIQYEQPGIETNQQYLQGLFELLADIASGYPAVLALGGEAVPALEKMARDGQNILRYVAVQLLYDIGYQTGKHLRPQLYQLVCARCLTRFTAHKVRLHWWQGITYYGCRICGQSRRFYSGQVVAVLDSRSTSEVVERNGDVRVNWLMRRTLFDFDRVEFLQATDEEIERFAVQVGNDTDEERVTRYRQMDCLVEADCQLSANSLRILQHTFGGMMIHRGEAYRIVQPD